MPRTADGARACERTGGGEVAGSAKLRADTSEIVSCVARYCQEDDPEVTRRRRTEASKAGDGCTKEIDAPDMQGGGCGGSGAEAESDTSVVSKVELLELPLIPDAFAGVGYSAVEQHGEMRLRQIVQMHEAWLPTQGENILVWDLDAELSPAVENFCSVSETQGCSEVAALLRPQRELRRIQCDWSETKSGDKFLFNESCNLLRKVIKSNTRMLLSRKDIIVPNAFENDWGQALNDVLLSPSTTKGGGEMHQLLLPIDLVREDEEKIKGAPSKLVSTASSYWLRFKETNVSLLKAAMRVPCVWNHAHAIDGLAKIATKEMTTMATQLKPGPTPCPTALHVQPAQMTSEKEVHQNAITKDSTVTLRNPLPGDECDGNVPQVDNPQLFTKVVINADDSPLSTDYFLSDKFLRCDWSDLSDDASGTHNTNSSDDQEALDYRQLLEQLARPVLWDLMRKKVIQVDKASFQRALNCISLEKLEAIIYQQFLNVRKMSENPSAVSSVEIFEACSNLRQAVWLHTLRIISILQVSKAQKGAILSAVTARLLASTKYKLLLGPSNWKDLVGLLKAVGNRARQSDISTQIAENNDKASPVKVCSTIGRPHKKQKVVRYEKEATPVRVLCSVHFLKQDELLDELCTEQLIYFIERDLPPPIDILVDERNCICVVPGATLQAETTVQNFIFSLARLQVQFQKCWLVIALDCSPSSEVEEHLNLFFTALVQFRVDIQVFLSFSCEETSRYIRAVVDDSAEVAMNCYRIFPRLWFKRPFLLEEESQFERFLVSTNIVNHYAAQSLLHKISLEDLFTKCIDELRLLVQSAVTDKQLQLLWELVHQNHGLRLAM